MRAVFKYVAAGLFAVFAIISAFTIETILEELGYPNAIKDITAHGVTAMNEDGYAIWVLLGLAFTGGATVALWVDYFIRKKTTVTVDKVSTITKYHSKESFRNEEVLLDGHSYKKCTFNNVTFVYNGGPVEFEYNNVSGFTLRTDVPEFDNYAFMMAQFGRIKGPLEYRRGGEVKVDGKFGDSDDHTQES